MTDDHPEDEQPCRHVIHLPVLVRDIGAAADLAVSLAESMAFLHVIDAGEVTVSPEDAQGVRHRVFCDRLLPGAGRCGARHGHPHDCVPVEVGTESGQVPPERAATLGRSRSVGDPVEG